MTLIARSLLLMLALQAGGWAYGQATSLPPGTSAPDDTSSAATTEPAGHAAALVSRAEDAILRNEYAKALPLLNDAIAAAPTTSPQTARAYYDRGYIEQQQNHLSDAEEDFRHANVADPKQFESHAALGQLLTQQKQWKEARRQLELAAASRPANGNPIQSMADVDRMLARVDAQMNDLGAAGDALLAALKLTPEQPDDTLLAAQLAEQEDNFTGAEQAYRKVLTEDPKSISAAEGLARVLIHEKKFAAAEPVLAAALQQEPNDPVLLAQSATALAGEGKNEAAISQLETLHAQNPNQPAVTRMLADLYSGSGEPAKADPLYSELLAAGPKTPSLLTAAGENELQEQKWGNAVGTLEESLNLQAAQPDAWSDLAFAASEDGQYALTLTALDHRAQYLPDVPATYFLRATALDHLHHPRQAIAYYRRFLLNAQGKFPSEEAQTRQRLKELGQQQ